MTRKLCPYCPTLLEGASVSIVNAIFGAHMQANHPDKLGAARTSSSHEPLPPLRDESLSAQPCGCDPGANWKCETHK